jgi:NADH-quinone oxidoreductase subunit G
VGWGGAGGLGAVTHYNPADDRRGRIVMACMTPAVDGARLSVYDPEALQFRGEVIEWLMSNHPHDCPVCEEGGECHLQDMTVMSGHTYRRFRFQKRTHRNQYLGPFINHEMNRCIACYRCVRFYREYAGGGDLDALGAHHYVYFGRHEDGVLENEFSGNLVEVCPTGVFTDKPLGETYTRKWDLRTAPSVCLHCGTGCNTSPGERYGRLKRIQNRYHGAINGYFLCDRGRFGHGFVHHPERVRTALRRDDGDGRLRPLAGDAALERLRTMLRDGAAIGIGSTRASLETNFALRELVGPERFSTGMSAHDQRLVMRILRIIAEGPAHVPTLTEMEQADAVLVLGEDLTNTAPRIALSLRQAARSRAKADVAHLGVQPWNDYAVRYAMPRTRTPFFLLSATATRLDDAATTVWRGAPDDIARLGYAIAHELDPERNGGAPAVDSLDPASASLAGTIADTLRNAERPLVVSGFGLGSEAVIEAAANVAWALCSEKNGAGKSRSEKSGAGKDRSEKSGAEKSRSGKRHADLCLTVPEANSLGLALMGGEDVDRALERLTGGEADTLIVAENDLYRRAGRARVDAALAAARHVVVLDALHHETVRRADLVLPAGTFAEADGTVVNYEGRAQRFFQVFPPADDIREGWRWLDEAATGTRRPLDAITAACAEAIPALAAITGAAPSAGYRIAGMRMTRELHRYSGRTAMHADMDISEPKPPEDIDSPISFTMEGHQVARGQPAPLLPTFWAPRWNSIQSVKKFQAEINGPLAGGDAGVRLLEPAEPATPPAYFQKPPDAFKPDGKSWRVVPLHHIFGSDELSAASAPVAERIPEPYLALNAAEAATLGYADGDMMTVTLDGREHRLPVRHDPELAPGTVGIPRGLPGMPATLPERIAISGAPT